MLGKDVFKEDFRGRSSVVPVCPVSCRKGETVREGPREGREGERWK